MEQLQTVMNDDFPPCELVTIHCTKLTQVQHLQELLMGEADGTPMARNRVKRTPKPRAKTPHRQLVFSKDSELFIPKDNTNGMK